MSRVRKIRATVMATLGVLLLTGCSGLFRSERPVEQTYVITPAVPEQTGTSAPLPFTLSIARPRARPGLDTARIAVLHADRRLDYFAGSRWSAPAGELVQSLLLESLRGAQRLRTVQADPAAFNADYFLQTELQDFQAEYHGSGAPTVHVTLMCTLGRVRDRRPLTGFVAAAEVGARANKMSAVAAAFEEAYQAAARAVVERTMEALSMEMAQTAARDVNRP